MQERIEGDGVKQEAVARLDRTGEVQPGLPPRDLLVRARLKIDRDDGNSRHYDQRRQSDAQQARAQTPPAGCHQDDEGGQRDHEIPVEVNGPGLSHHERQRDGQSRQQRQMPCGHRRR